MDVRVKPAKAPSEPLTVDLTEAQRAELGRIMDALDRDLYDLWNLWPYNKRVKELTLNDPFAWVRFARSPNCATVRAEVLGDQERVKLTAEDDKGRVRVMVEVDPEGMSEYKRFELAEFVNKYPDRPAKAQERFRAYSTARSVLLRGLYKS